MSGPVERYDALRAEYKFVFVVFYRGSWCPFCQKWLKDLQPLSSEIASAGGKVIAVTSEAESELPKMRAASGYTGETIVDPQNQLAKELKKRGLLDVAISERKGYPNGMVQPAVLVGGSDVGEVMYSWAVVPSRMNLGGAKDRPALSEVWDNVRAKIDGKPQVHAKLNNMGFISGMRQMIFG